MVKPFVDAVNSDGKDRVEVDVYFSGAISPDQSQQPRLVSSGTADIALIVPGRTPDRFPDTAVLALPGLFKNSLEATRTYAQLVANDALAGYSDYYVIGAYVSDAEDIHSRKPIEKLADLKGLKIRVNNDIEAGVLEQLGAIPVLLAINNTTEAVSRGVIDGAAFPPSMVFQFGIGRVAANHYIIGLGGAPTALVMNRAKFDSLPPDVQTIIRRHSGAAFSVAAAKMVAAQDQKVRLELQSDPRRKFVIPDAADSRIINAAFAKAIEEYASRSDHNRALVDAMQRGIRQTTGQ